MKFAFVDDSSETLSQLNTLVHKFGNTHGYSLDSESFSSGEDFLASFTPFSYDIIFMDIYMTGMNGIHTAKSLRQLDSKAMIIFLTSSMEHMVLFVTLPASNQAKILQIKRRYSIK